MEFIENAIMAIDALKWWIIFVIVFLIMAGIYEKRYQD